MLNFAHIFDSFFSGNRIHEHDKQREILLNHWSLSLKGHVRARAIHEAHSILSFEEEGSSKENLSF